jgi:MYXO-CTERM domain-containing protein
MTSDRPTRAWTSRAARPALGLAAAAILAACSADPVNDALPHRASPTTSAAPAPPALLRWTGLGRGSAIAAVTRPDRAAEVDGNHAVYRRADGSEEQYVNGPLGLEQTFVIATPPAGAAGEPLAIELTAAGGLAPALIAPGEGVALRDAHGATVARYTGLAAFDADGAPRRAWMEVEGGAVRLRVDDAGARYPLRIDPLLWTQQAQLSASDAAPSDGFGASVSLSGGRAVVGAPGDGSPSTGSGKAYVFVRSGSDWIEEAELAPSDGAPGDQFGWSVSQISDRIVVGAPAGGQDEPGAAYVFVQSGGTWTQEAKLTVSAPPGNPQFGYAVSASDSTVIVGARYAQESAGAAYVFARNGTIWTQQAELLASDGAQGDELGTSVALSGGTAVVGAPARDFHHGVAFVFAQSGTTWTQQAELSANDGATDDAFGTSVALSGTTAIVGAPGRPVHGYDGAGVLYVFGQSGATWAQQVELSASDAAAGDNLGQSVSMYGDTVIAGAPFADGPAGVAYVFARSGAAWTQEARLTASADTSVETFGGSVSLDDGTAVIGTAAPTVFADSPPGAAFVFGSACTGQGGGSTCGSGGSGGSPSGSGSSGSSSSSGVVGKSFRFGGCGCVAAPAPPLPPSAAALAALLALAARRRRARPEATPR